jgi:DNA-binding NarL/FixJ family response regulator
VLLCDDAVAFPALFTRWMRDGGIDAVDHAETADEAIALARKGQPEVIVVDHLLPDGTSEELVPRLREAAPAARVLLISGMPDDTLEEAARAAGADGHLGKAATAEQMRDAVLALLA